MERYERYDEIRWNAKKMYPLKTQFKQRTAFIEGAEWADRFPKPDGDWLEANVQPEYGSKLLIDSITYGIVLIKWADIILSWDTFTQVYKVTQWMYIDEWDADEINLPF